ncbi:hypothetical protein [Kitasatospora sp. NPDC094015]
MTDRSCAPDGPAEESATAQLGDADLGLLDDGAWDDVITRSVN